MGRIPISIKKIKIDNSRRSLQSEVSETVSYLFTLEEKGEQWQKTFVCDRNDLLKLRNELDKLIEETTTAEVLQITNDKAKIIDEHYKTDELCQNCNYKLTYKCKECLFVLQSPLERKLYLELSKSYLKFQTQYPLNWYGQNISIEGKTYGDCQNNFKEVLTVVDFYIEKRQTKLCIYTDGHTYHERTEEQAQRDRNIDRKLQELGFQVLRYTGKEVKENCEKIITDINKWIK
ncbi:endonuclease domain-containing protein [Flavobacterium taihuense]|uniref:Endonuclease domain-containing protein n=1 Tax=Flavobacterium taihuense TaxID=2857508 RepID=A0ABS6Y0K7_9FLAO|nr:DUF559 domain-containing protein [Flavobacterium taihuense]MBW4362445.1 endonuclease domain-containing protein [Flavobacterium taihuense]